MLLGTTAEFSYAQSATVTYAASAENFPNPERGLYHYTELRSPNTGLSVEQLTGYREQESITLIYRIFYLEDFRDQPISEEYLTTVRQDFATMRAAGIKCVLRFAYTDKFVNGFDNPPYNDAPPLDLLLEHVDQLAPIIRANIDVVAVMQAGFIGTWGEWYYSDLYTTSGNLEQPSESDWDNRRSLIDKLLQIVPPNRMVQVRYPVAKFALVGSEEPLTAEEAYRNTPRARIAHHNDCFVSSSTDVGTYKDLEPEKAFLEQDSRYLAVGGETCALSPPTSDCPNAEAELARFHWSYLNIDYNTEVLGAWEEQGCWEDIVRTLGYRLRLTEATMQNQVKAADAFSLELSLVNEGYASPYNPRQVNIILRNTETNETFVHRTDEDPRRWLPGEPITISVEAGVPASLVNGNYEVLLHLADPEAAVTARPEYAIRLANEDVWESETGYNALQHTLEVNATAPGSAYQGEQYFTPLTPKLLNGPTRIRIDGEATDWTQVQPAIVADGQDVPSLRVFNSADSLYVLIEGVSPDAYQLLLDTDNLPSTGYRATEWPASGPDYLVENGRLLVYAGDGTTEAWQDVAAATVATGIGGQEIGVALSDLGGLADFFRIGYAGGDQFLPVATQPLRTVAVLPAALATRLDLRATVSGHQAIVYWEAEPIADDNELVLERSTDGGASYQMRAVLGHEAFTFTDYGLEGETEVRYRLYARTLTQFSDYSALTTITTPAEAVGPPTQITPDASLDDWASVAPLATASTTALRALRVFNDRDSLYFSVEGTELTGDFQLFIDTDNNVATGFTADGSLAGGAELRIATGTLSRYTEAGTWEEVTAATVAQAATAIEGAIPVTPLPKGRISVAWLDDAPPGEVTPDLPAAGQPWPTYRLALASSVPDDLKATLSSREPTSRILLSWGDVDDELGYTIERSTGDSLTFVEVAEVAPNTTQFLDIDLPGGTAFYYRIRSFNAVGLSTYSPVVQATTEGSPVTDLEDEANAAVSLRVYPNPAHERATVVVQLPSSHNLTLTAYNSIGVALQTITSGTYAAGTHHFPLQGVVTEPPGRLLLVRLQGTDDSDRTWSRTVRLLIN